MTVAYVNSGGIAQASGVSSVTPSLPASRVNGNLLIVAYRLIGTSATLSAGWTKIGADQVISGTWTLGAAYRFVDGSETAPTCTSTSTTAPTACVFQFSGVSSIGAFAWLNGASGAHTTSSITTTAADSLALLLDIVVSASAFSDPAGWTPVAQETTTGSRISMSSKQMTTSGSATGGTTTSDVAAAWAAIQIELQPAAPPATGTSTANIPQLTGSITGFTGNSSDSAIPKLTGSISGKRIFDEVVNSGIAIATDVGAGGLIELSASSIAAITSAGFPGSILTADANSAMLLQSIALAPRVFVETAASGMTAATSGAATKAISLTGSSIFVAVSGGQAQAVYILSAESVAALMTGTQFVMDFTDGWAYNLNTGAPSFYEGMKFNSFAMIGGEYFGCNETGIHRLTGDKDGADDIRATITLGTSRLDSDREKTVPVAYVGARSAEPMVLTCRVEGEEYSYEFSRETAVMAPARVKPGKGLKGVYWEFEIENQNGADLDLDMLEVVTAPVSRRV